MKTKIISAFPGVGKTHFKDSMDGTDVIVADSDSSGFSWMPNEGGKIRNPDFPENYINHIKSLIGKVDYVLVSSHLDVRRALVDTGIWFTLVYPSMECKKEYIERYKQRGSPDSFIQLVEENWDKWITELSEQGYCDLIELSPKTYLSDYIKQL